MWPDYGKIPSIYTQEKIITGNSLDLKNIFCLATLYIHVDMHYVSKMCTYIASYICILQII